MIVTSSKFKEKLTQNQLPLLPDRSCHLKEDDKNKQIDSKTAELERHIKRLERKYKQNLKEGFENKIKSFRLSSVMERKMIKASIEQTKREIEEEEILEKTIRAKSQREEEQERMNAIFESKKNRALRARSQIENEKELFKRKLKEITFKESEQSKEAHDKVIEEIKFGEKKKKYFQFIKMEKSQREIEKEKETYALKIVENISYLGKLKKELDDFQIHPKSELKSISLKESSFSSQPNPFITF